METPFIIASITKLFTTACIFNLSENHRISFNDKISKYIDEEILKGLCVFKGEDYSFDITINNSKKAYYSNLNFDILGKLFAKENIEL